MVLLVTVIFHKISVFFATLITQKETDWNAFESEVSSKLVFEITLIGKMRQFLVVDEKRERGRLNGNLCSVIDLEMSSLVLRSRNLGNGFRDHLIKNARSKALFRILIYCLDKRKKLIYSLSGLGRDKQYGRVIHERKTLLDDLGHLFKGTGLLIDKIPLVDNDYGSFAVIVSQACDPCILLCNACLCIDEDNTAAAPP